MDTEVCDEARLDELAQDERDPETLLVRAQAQETANQWWGGLSFLDRAVIEACLDDFPEWCRPAGTLVQRRARTLLDELQELLRDH